MPRGKQFDRQVIRLCLHYRDTTTRVHSFTGHGVSKRGQWQIAQRRREELGLCGWPRTIQDRGQMRSQACDSRGAQRTVVQQEVRCLMGDSQTLLGFRVVVIDQDQANADIGDETAPE